MAKQKEIKTNAMRILDKNKISYEVLQYECDEFIDGLHTAQKTGAPVEQSFKTLIVQGKSKEYYVVVIPIALEIDLKKHYRDREFQGPSQRVKVFECSCCPPNVVRMLSSIQRFMYSQDENVVYCHQFADSETKLNIKGINAVLIQKTDYPYSGKIDFTVKGADIKLKIRIPSWCTEFEGTKENGYITVDLKKGESFTLNLPMNIHFIEANPNVQDNSGRYALMRGPVVYCMEGIDNGENLRDITILENGESEIIKDEYLQKKQWQKRTLCSTSSISASKSQAARTWVSLHLCLPLLCSTFAVSPALPLNPTRV